jgi:protein dithiol:quinone oxidoreductase
MSHSLSPSLLRYGYLAGFLICAGLLGAAYYFEIVMYLDPCPLCMVQRLAVLIMGIGCLLAYIFDDFRWPSRLFLALVTASAVFGYFVADHQVWLQHLPADQVPACGPGFDYLLETLPMSELLQVMLHGDGSCAEVTWAFWGMSMAEWTRVFFVGFTLAGFISLIISWRRGDRRDL